MFLDLPYTAKAVLTDLLSGHNVVTGEKVGAAVTRIPDGTVAYEIPEALVADLYAKGYLTMFSFNGSEHFWRLSVAGRREAARMTAKRR